MRKIAVALLAAAVLPLSALTVQAAPPEESGPPCADIVNGGAVYGYNSETDTGTLFFAVETEAPSCEAFDYTLYVFDEDDDLDPIAAPTTLSGDGTTAVEFGPITTTDDDNTVCVQATVSVRHHVFDVGKPDDAECAEYTRTTGGGQGFR
jgi:hypothetical protein